MRYLVPTTITNGEISAGFPHAFTSSGKVTIKKSNEVKGFSISTNKSESSLKIFTDSTTITNAQAYSYSSFYPISISAKITLDTLSAAKTHMSVSNTSSLLLPGEFACISSFGVSRILDSVKTHFSRLDSQKVSGSFSLYASISNGTVSCSTGITINTDNIFNINSNVTWNKPVCLYSRIPVKPEIVWQVFLDGVLFYRDIESPEYEVSNSPKVESKLFASSQKILSLEKVLPKSMAATFGFIDTAFALLALEEDVIPDQLSVFYEKSGVPLCNEEDIFADSSDVVFIPATGLYEENSIFYQTSIKNKMTETVKNLFNFFKCFSVNSKLVIHFDYKFYDGHSPYEIALYSQNGRCLAKWNKSEIGSVHSVEWSLREHGIAPGSYIIRAKMGSVNQAKTVMLF